MPVRKLIRTLKDIELVFKTSLKLLQSDNPPPFSLPTPFSLHSSSVRRRVVLIRLRFLVIVIWIKRVMRFKNGSNIPLYPWLWLKAVRKTRNSRYWNFYQEKNNNNKTIKKKTKQTGVNFTPKKYYRKKLVKMRNDLIHPSLGCRALQNNPELLIIVSLSSV